MAKKNKDEVEDVELSEDEQVINPVPKDERLTWVTMFKVPKDDFCWRAVAITTKGDALVDRKDICTPNIRAIVEENFKIFIARNLFRK